VTALARLLAGLALLVSATSGALALTAGPAAASCAEPSIDLLETSDVAFLGIVTNRAEPGDEVVVTVRTDSVFKGEVTRRVDVVSSDEDDQSPLLAGTTDRVIVFGTLVDGEVHSDQCTTLTGPGKAYAEMLAELGEGTEPSAGYMKAERRTLGISYETFSTVRGIFGALALIAMGYFLFRRWRARRRTR
jgi:hypothetical protein